MFFCSFYIVYKFFFCYIRVYRNIFGSADISWSFKIRIYFISNFIHSLFSICVLLFDIIIIINIYYNYYFTVKMIIGYNFIIKEQMTVRHQSVVFRNINKLFFRIAYCIVSEITSESACKVRHAFNFRGFIII